MEEATINDIPDSSTFLSTFSTMKGTATALRNTADAAALLARGFDSCGVGKFSTYDTGETISIVTKSCALGYFSFGHELAYNFGAHHNPEVATNPDFSYGHGHLILQGGDTQGYRTIMSFYSPNHVMRVNHYSNPSVDYSATGTSTGDVTVSNNAAVITANRVSFSTLGDESATCISTTTTTTTTTIATTTTTTMTSAAPILGMIGTVIKILFLHIVRSIGVVQKYI